MTWRLPGLSGALKGVTVLNGSQRGLQDRQLLARLQPPEALLPLRSMRRVDAAFSETSREKAAFAASSDV
jgi:hypothetical protein